jgi:hypothetical protein
MTVTVGFVLADEYSGVLKKVDGNKITVQKTKKVDKKNENDGDPVVLTVNSDAVISKGKGAKGGKFEATDKIETGLKDDIFTKIDEKKGVNVRITADGDKVSQILVIGGKKKAAN